MATLDKVKQCWENAFESEEDYKVKVGSVTQAISFRSQCYKWRRARALEFNPVNPESHPLYSMEIKFERTPDWVWIVFSKANEIELPPPTGRAPKMMWCALKRGDDYVFEQLPVPVTDSNFILGGETEAAVRDSLEKRLALEAEMRGEAPSKKPSLFPVE